MKLFIDTNIFLDFYTFTSEDLTKLKQLAFLIKNKEIDLLLPQQVIDETYRYRSKVINDSFKGFKQEKFKLNFPSYCKEHKQYGSMRKCLIQLEEFHHEMIETLQYDIDNQKLPADLFIRKLFHYATKINNTQEIIERARQRVELENPPGKKGSIADAVIWESLLAEVPIWNNFSFISSDSDFCSPLNRDKLNEFLQREWNSRHPLGLYFYRNLSEFFKNNPFLEIDLKTENEKDYLIQSLSESSNITVAHFLIERLSGYDFTQLQAENLVNILFLNSYVNSIFTYPDIARFYRNIYDNFPFLKPHQRTELEVMLNKVYQINEIKHRSPELL